jgi:hypothetical protein
MEEAPTAQSSFIPPFLHSPPACTHFPPAELAQLITPTTRPIQTGNVRELGQLMRLANPN